MEWLVVLGGSTAFVGFCVLFRLQWQETQLARGAELLAMGLPADAEACFRKTVGIAERRFGADHWRVAMQLQLLGLSLLLQGRADEAAPFVEGALAIVDRLEPLPVPVLGFVFVTAARLRRVQRRLDESAELLARARASLGPAAFSSKAAGVAIETFLELRDVDAAVDALPRGGQLGQHEASLYGRVGAAALSAGRAEDAVRCFDQAIAVASSRTPAAHAVTFYRFARADALSKLDRHAEALAELEAVLADYDARPSAEIAAVDPLLRFAETALLLGDRERARAACDRVLELVPAARAGESPYRRVALSPLDEASQRATALLADMGAAGA
jgi:tetratricopeptide (TPR) repeat protein